MTILLPAPRAFLEELLKIPFWKVVRDSTGVDRKTAKGFAAHGSSEATIKKRVKYRLQKSGLSSYASYLECVAENRDLYTWRAQFDDIDEHAKHLGIDFQIPIAMRRKILALDDCSVEATTLFEQRRFMEIYAVVKRCPLAPYLDLNLLEKKLLVAKNRRNAWHILNPIRMLSALYVLAAFDADFFPKLKSGWTFALPRKPKREKMEWPAARYFDFLLQAIIDNEDAFQRKKGKSKRAGSLKIARGDLLWNADAALKFFDRVRKGNFPSMGKFREVSKNVAKIPGIPNYSEIVMNLIYYRLRCFHSLAEIAQKPSVRVSFGGFDQYFHHYHLFR